MTEKEFARKFLALVYSNAPWKSYEKTLGLDKPGYQYHLGKLDYYNKLLDEAPVEKKKPVVKPVKTKPIKAFEKDKKKEEKKYEGED